MGKIHKLHHESLISPSPDRNSNLVRVYEMENKELVIHFRNVKIVLITPEERAEWIGGFKVALQRFYDGNYFPNDL